MDTQTWAQLGFGAALAICGGFIKHLWSKLTRQDERIGALEIKLPEKYVAKEDLRDMFQQIMNHLDKIDAKLDGEADK